MHFFGAYQYSGRPTDRYAIAAIAPLAAQWISGAPPSWKVTGSNPRFCLCLFFFRLFDFSASRTALFLRPSRLDPFDPTRPPAPTTYTDPSELATGAVLLYSGPLLSTRTHCRGFEPRAGFHGCERPWRAPYLHFCFRPPSTQSRCSGACTSVWTCLLDRSTAARALLAPRLVVAPDAPCWRVPVSS